MATPTSDGLVRYIAANGHLMEYYASETDPTRPASGHSFQAWCADNCPACAEGEPLPDW